MKSAWELAMERAEASTGPLRNLTDEQKAALEEVSVKANARIAELKIMRQSAIDANKFAGEAQAAALLEEQLRSEIQKIEADAEEEREVIRRSSSS